jgi:hypothetical protein
MLGDGGGSEEEGDGVAGLVQIRASEAVARCQQLLARSQTSYCMPWWRRDAKEWAVTGGEQAEEHLSHVSAL